MSPQPIEPGLRHTVCNPGPCVTRDRRAFSMGRSPLVPYAHGTPGTGLVHYILI
jgi:hypothetical protein